MPVIYSSNGVTIQTYKIARQAVGAAAQIATDIALDRPGAFIGVATALDADNLSGPLAVYVRKTDNTEISYGEALTQIRVALRNDNAGGRTFGAHVVIFIAK